MRLYLNADGEAPEASLYKLRYVGEELIKKDLESLDGVAAVKVNGGYEEEIQVHVDEAKLALVGLTPRDIQEVLARENVNQAAGSLYEEEARYLVRANNEFQSLDDILQTIVLEKEGRRIRLADVATVERGHKLREVITRFEAQEAVELAIYKEGDANTVRVAQSVRNRLEALRREVPDGIAVGAGVDQSRFIQSAIDEVLGNAVLGGLLAMLVLYLFLKDAFSTFIVGISIPVSIIATFFLMYRMGVSLNVMSMGGLALGVGMLVDNAIVVLEAIFRRKESGDDPIAASTRGASEVGQAVIASTLTTVAVFLPVVFVEGIAAQLFRDQAITVSLSLLASLAVALTLIPMLAARGGSQAATPQPTGTAPGQEALERWQRLRRAVFHIAPSFTVRMLRLAFAWLGKAAKLLLYPISRPFDAALARVLHRYPAVLAGALARPWTVMGVATALLVAAILSGSSLGLDLIPSLSQGEFSYKIELPEGTSLPVTDRTLLAAQRALAEDDNVESYSAIIGGAGLSLASTGTEGENVGRIDVRMTSNATPEAEAATIALLREKLAEIPQARVKFERPSYFSFRTPIEIEVYGERSEALNEVATDLRDLLQEIPGLVAVRSSAELGNPELQVQFDRTALSHFGLDITQVSQIVKQKVRGEVATRFNEGDREIDVLVRSSRGEDVRTEEVERLIVAQKDGTPVYLSSVAKIVRELGPSEIRRIGQKRSAVVSANLQDTNLSEAASAIREVLAEYSFPPSVVANLSGQEEERQRSFSSLLFALSLALFLVYIVMASQFESLLHPFVILFYRPPRRDRRHLRSGARRGDHQRGRADRARHARRHRREQRDSPRRHRKPAAGRGDSLAAMPWCRRARAACDRSS